MQVISNIKRLAKQQRIRIKDIAEQIGMSETGLHYAFTNQTIQLKYFLRICQILNVEPGELFENDTLTVNEPTAKYSPDIIRHFMSEIEFKNQEITKLHKVIDKLSVIKN